MRTLSSCVAIAARVPALLAVTVAEIGAIFISESPSRRLPGRERLLIAVCRHNRPVVTVNTSQHTTHSTPPRHPECLWRAKISLSKRGAGLASPDLTQFLHSF